MRDAAVQAAESWGDLGMREVLSSHTEAVPWLRAYIEDVVEDLRRVDSGDVPGPKDRSRQMGCETEY